MQPFTCSQCGHGSTFDPRVESAHCPRCGYAPAPQGRVSRHGRKRTGLRGSASHQRFLDELLSHWNGTHIPDRHFQLPTPERAHAFFRDYQRALGEDPHMRPGARMRFVRSKAPARQAILWFMGAYLMLRHGDRAQAARHLQDLAELYPSFPDAWIWLAATTDDPDKRVDYLENAVLLEAAHPLARDALAVALGRVSPPGEAGDVAAQTRVTQCPQCAGALHYEAGAKEVVCQYCGHRWQLCAVNLIDGEAMLVGDLQLQRRFQGQTWEEVQRVVRCQGCGAELIMTRHMARQCLFCGSTSVLVEDSEHAFVQPDGFLPLQLGKEDVRAAIRKAQRSAGQRLRTWWVGKELQVGELQAVYLPFWVFDGFVEVRAQAASRFDRFGRAGLTLQQEAPVPRRDVMMFDNLVFSAVDFPPPELLGRILPYETKALVPYEPRLVADWPAALYQRDVEEVVETAYDVMLGLAVWRSKGQAFSAAGDYAQLRRTYQVSSATYQLVLLPVWVALAQREGRHRLVLVNGQTGKTTFAQVQRRSPRGVQGS
jgi:DNA-directed RNA polymerase subunit RPC12/RpoP